MVHPNLLGSGSADRKRTKKEQSDLNAYFSVFLKGGERFLLEITGSGSGMFAQRTAANGRSSQRTRRTLISK